MRRFLSLNLKRSKNAVSTAEDLSDLIGEKGFYMELNFRNVL